MNKSKILKELTEMIRHHTNVINDPMNGCPDDFSEDYAPIENSKINPAEEAGATQEEISKALGEGYELADQDYQEMCGDVQPK